MKKRQIYVLTYFFIVEAYVFCIPLPAPQGRDSSNFIKTWLSEDRLSLACGIAILFFLIFIAATFSEYGWPKPRKTKKAAKA